MEDITLKVDHLKAGYDGKTILNDIFSMTMLTTLDTEKADFDTVQDKLKAVGEDLGVQIIIQREDVFQYMYKI